jgi:ferredoxin
MEGSGPQELDQEQIDVIRTNLRKAASEVLTRNRAGVVIGYGTGTLENQTTPILVTGASDCDKLEWGHGCRNNLGTYIGRALQEHERVAVVAKTCDLGGITGLIREGQVRREQVLVIGVQCPGIHNGSEVATKCLACTGDPHPICDLVVTLRGVHESCEDPTAAALEKPDARDEQIAYLESLPHEERWKYWQRQFSRCLRCYACRAACPMCYCSSCIAEKHRPQWVPTAIDNSGNSAWNIIRAVHLAGRCSGCDECARVCPADIRLDLINRKLALEVERQYGKLGLDPEQKSALVDFRMEDAEEFIL